jgi:hypothetical protein
MKNRIISCLSAAILFVGISVCQGADKKQLAGPKGGRLFETTEPRMEFFLEKDHTATIAFYDAPLKPIPAAGQTVTIIVEGKAGKEKIDFEKKGGVLTSKGKLPEGDGYNLVLQVKEKADSKPRNFRFKLDTSICGDCKRAEYGCVCHE